MGRRRLSSRVQWSLIFASCWGLASLLPMPATVPSAWMTAYTAGITTVLVGLLAGLAIWAWQDGTPAAFVAGSVWLSLAVTLGLGVYAATPHAVAFWVGLPWTHARFWHTGCGLLIGSVGFWGLLGQGIAWGLAQMHERA